MREVFRANMHINKWGRMKLNISCLIGLMFADAHIISTTDDTDLNGFERATEEHVV